VIVKTPQLGRRRSGFTLVESMATIAVLGILGSTASFMVVDAVDDYTEASLQVQLHAEMSIALDRAMREIRKIELDAGAADVAPDITSMAVTLLQWEDSSGNAYQLGKSGSELQLQIAGGTVATLLTDVTDLEISIFDEDNADLGLSCAGATCDAVRRIVIDVTTQRSGVTESLRFKAFIRSTMSGA
jgi:prepilin-type N-terminal cleavage/methylation domain-containing protein